jgi:hypothetical protein
MPVATLADGFIVMLPDKSFGPLSPGLPLEQPANERTAKTTRTREQENNIKCLFTVNSFYSYQAPFLDLSGKFRKNLPKTINLKDYFIKILSI